MAYQQEERLIRCLVCGCMSNLLFDEERNRVRIKEELHEDVEQSLKNPETEDCSEYGARRRGNLEKNLEWEVSLFESFFKAIQSKPKTNKYQWNFEEEPVPFCNPCEEQLSSLRKLMDQLEKLESFVASSIGELKKRMATAEGEFQNDQVYQVDARYYWVRANVLGRRKVGLPPNSSLKTRSKAEIAIITAISTEETRRPSRRTASARARVCRESSESQLMEADGTTAVKPGQDDSTPADIKASAGRTGQEKASKDMMDLLDFDNLDVHPNHDNSERLLPGDRVKTEIDQTVGDESWTSVLSAEASPPELFLEERKFNRKISRKKTKINRKKMPRHKRSFRFPFKQSSKARKKSKIVYKDDFEDEHFNEDPPQPPSPPTTRRRKYKKNEDEDYEPPTDFDLTVCSTELAEPEVGASSEEEIDDQCPDLVMTGKKVKGVRFLQDTGQVCYHDVVFRPYAESELKQFQCSKCDRIVRSQLQVKQHVLKNHVGKFKCPRPNCSYRSDVKASVTCHIQRVHMESGKLKPECDICGRPMLRNHIPAHRLTHYSAAEREEAEERGEIPVWLTNQAPCQCEQCGRVFKDRKGMYYHEKFVHKKPTTTIESESPPEPQPTPLTQKIRKDLFMCPICGKTFTTGQSLRLHTGRLHPNKAADEWGSLQFACTFCERRFNSQLQLKEHKAIHTGDRPFHCQQCPKQFINQRLLDKHLKSHNRPFSCPDCPIAFMNKHHLKRHHDTYHAPGSNPKRKSFVRGPEQAPFRVMQKWKNAFQGESQVSAQRQRKCPECPAAFQYPSQLKRHMAIYHSSTKKAGLSEETLDNHGSHHPPQQSATINSLPVDQTVTKNAFGNEEPRQNKPEEELKRDLETDECWPQQSTNDSSYSSNSAADMQQQLQQFSSLPQNLTVIRSNNPTYFV